MRPRLAAAFVVLAAIVPAAVPAEPATPLFERNLAVLLATLPADAVIEVRIYDGEGERAELWTAEQYATLRAGFAASMGRDYAASPEGIPSGLGDAQETGEIFMDLWGAVRVNVATPVKCMPVLLDHSKMWYYPGPCFVAEHENACLDGICSFSYYWTVTQGGVTHGDTWFAGFGTLFLFPPPHGALILFDGTQWRENL